MPQCFLPVKKFSEEPYSNILGFPNPKKRQISAVADNLEVRNAKSISVKTNNKIKFIDIGTGKKKGIYESIIKENDFIIQNLAKVNKIFWNEKSYNIKDCITITLKDLKALIPIKKIIDVDQELSRLKKNLSLLESLLDKVNQKINNKKYDIFRSYNKRKTKKDRMCLC